MGQILSLPTPISVDAAWERYRRFAAALADDPRLAADRAHMEAMVRAEREWKDAFIAQERRA